MGGGKNGPRKKIYGKKPKLKKHAGKKPKKIYYT